MNRLTTKERAQIIGMMCEGVSLRSITRLTGVSRTTTHKLLEDAGAACLAYQDDAFRNLNSDRIQVDEIWSFVGAKQANATEEQKAAGWGDAWTWTAIDADSKLVPCWLVGPRNAQAAQFFLSDLAGRLKNRVQLTSDGFGAYPKAVEIAFGEEVDYAMLVKVYGSVPGKSAERRYSPAECIGAEKHVVTGYPLKRDISTSYVERQNLNMRMGMRRFTRLTNAHSKKVENHAHALSIYFMHYNFVRIHQTLRVTPAMAAGVTDKLWSLEDVINIVDEWGAAQMGVVASGN